MLMAKKNSIKIGDNVVFYWTGTTSRRQGQVIDIIEAEEDNICVVFFEKDQMAYDVEESKVKKI